MTNSQVPALKDLYQHAFKMGVAVSEDVLERKAPLIAHHFNSVTAENVMKFESLQPEEGVFDFESSDRIVRYAMQNGMAVRGHTLVWHNQTPDWVFEGEDGKPASRDLLLQRMKKHIDTVMKHYEEEITTWDVVNEAISDKGSDLLRSSKWRELIGDDFIEHAFRFAHEANPKAQLFYNDYNEVNPEKADKIYQMLQSLIEKGVPIHGLGLQCHWNVGTPEIATIKAALEKYASLGLRLHVTEMDVSIYPHGEEAKRFDTPPAERLEQQANRYEQFFQLFHSYRNVIDSVTFWGVDDSYTWLDHFPVPNRKNWPFVFDEQSNPKAAFWEIANIFERNK